MLKKPATSTVTLKFTSWLQGLLHHYLHQQDDLGICPKCDGRLKIAWEPMSARCDTCDYFE